MFKGGKQGVHVGKSQFPLKSKRQADSLREPDEVGEKTGMVLRITAANLGKDRFPKRKE